MEASQTIQSKPSKIRRIPQISISPSVPPPIREDMIGYQVPVVRELVRQFGVEEMWLSNLFQRQLDGIPLAGTIDYPVVIAELEKSGEVKILETVNQQYRDHWGELFRPNIRFKVLKLAPRWACLGRSRNRKKRDTRRFVESTSVG